MTICIYPDTLEIIKSFLVNIINFFFSYDIPFPLIRFLGSHFKFLNT